MIEIQKDPKADAFNITQTISTEQGDYHKQITLNVTDLDCMFRWLRWNFIEPLVGSSLEKCINELKKAHDNDDILHNTKYANFNGTLISSDLSVEDAYQKVFHMSYADFNKKVQKEMEQWKSRLSTTKVKSCGQ